MTPQEQERILCAAIHYDDGNEYADSTTIFGVVISGFRHSDCYLALEVLAGEEAVNKVTRDHQGFLTNHKRYVSRAEAWKIAEAANQIVYGYETCKGPDAILISENLY